MINNLCTYMYIVAKTILVNINFYLFDKLIEKYQRCRRLSIKALVIQHLSASSHVSFLFDFSRTDANMGFATLWYSHPRKYGQGSRCCRACSNRHGLIRKYGLDMCRQCFREYANDIGFKKLD